jgi:Ca-activated chloride channel family protein
VDSNLVLVPVTVTDQRGAIVAGLTRGDFQLSEEKQSQDIISFAHETAPISLGIVVDLSGSMANKMDKLQAAVESIVANLEDEDEAFVISFGDHPRLRSQFSSDPVAILNALAFSEAYGSTSLFDAVALAVREMRSAQNRRKTLFVISDGGDNHSRMSGRELRSLLEEADIQIQAIGIHDHPTGMAPTDEEARGPWILDDLAKITGGQHHMVQNARELPGLAAEISLALHDRYLLGYKPAPTGPSGSFRRIEVKLARPKEAHRLFVYARRGYRMP